MPAPPPPSTPSASSASAMSASPLRAGPRRSQVVGFDISPTVAELNRGHDRTREVTPDR